MKELIIKKGDKQIALADKEDVMDALENKSDKSHDHDLKDLNIYADGQGGTNLIEDTQIFNTPLTNVGLRDGTYKNCTYRRIDNTSGTNYLDIVFKIPAGTFKHGEKYTLSFWAKGTGNIVVFNTGGTNYIKTKPINCTSGGTNTQNFSQYTDGNVNFTLTSEWKRYFVTWELNPESNSTNDISVNKTIILRTIAGADAYWAGVMYERGEIPHDWSPSPKDIPRKEITASSTSIADLNNYKKAGFYYNGDNNESKYIIHCPNSDGTNTPYTNNHAFFLLVEDWGDNTHSVKQTLTYYDNDTTYIRRYVNGSWTTWGISLNSSNYSTYANKTTVTDNLTTDSSTNALSAKQGKILNDRYKGITISGINVPSKPYLRLFNIESTASSSSGHLIFEIFGINNDSSYAKVRVDLRRNSNSPPSGTCAVVPLNISKRSNIYDNLYFAHYIGTNKSYVDIFFKTTQYRDCIFKVYDDQLRNGKYTMYKPIVAVNPANDVETYTTVEGAGTALYNASYTNIINKSYNDIVASSFIKDGGTSSQFLKADGSVDTNTYAKSSDLTSAKIVDTNTYSNINNTAQTQKSINEAINNRLAALNDLDLVKVVGSKPTPSANTMNKLYLTTESPSVEEDKYEIFITVRSGSSGNYTYDWEKVDTARVNLSDYIQTNDPRLTDKRKPAATLIDASSTNPVDLNTIREIGFYYTLSSDDAKYVSNCPNSSTGSAPFNDNKIFYLLVETLGNGSDKPNVKQTLTYYNSNTVWVRTKSGGSDASTNWSNWSQLIKNDDSRLSDARTPTSHTHGNLQNDGRVGTSNNTSKNVVTDENGKITTEAKNNHNHDGTYIKTGTGTVTSTNIADGTIVNADIADNAAIAYSKLSGVASSTHNHNSDYVKLSGGQTMNGNILIPSNADSSNDYATGNIPYAGTITNASSVQNFCKTHKSFIGVINDGTWRHLISSRHRNGAGDGNNYGFYISSDNNVNGHLKFNKEWTNVWGTERTLIDNENMVKHEVVNNVLTRVTNNQSTAGYFKILTIGINGDYIDSPIQFTINRRHIPVTNVQFYVQYYQKDTSSTINPRYYKLDNCYYDGQEMNIYVKQTVDNAGAGTFDIYTYAEAWSDLSITPIVTNNVRNAPDYVTITPKNAFVTSLPSGCTQATRNPNYAPVNHATTSTTYGAGSSTNYGHVKLSDNYTSSAGAASTGISASSKAVADAYNTLNTNKADKSSYVTCTVTYADGSNPQTINLVTR